MIAFTGFSRQDAKALRKNKQIALYLSVFARNKSYQFQKRLPYYFARYFFAVAVLLRF
jgi:hypothetical protein